VGQNSDFKFFFSKGLDAQVVISTKKNSNLFKEKVLVISVVQPQVWMSLVDLIMKISQLENIFFYQFMYRHPQLRFWSAESAIGMRALPYPKWRAFLSL